jgi:cell division protein FtsB
LHAHEGPRGFPYKEAQEEKLAALKAKHETLLAERLRMENKVSLLRPDSIDPDLLDELARGQLELARPTDVVAFTRR